jgi:hypothetical protein
MKEPNSLRELIRVLLTQVDLIIHAGEPEPTVPPWRLGSGSEGFGT